MRINVKKGTSYPYRLNLLGATVMALTACGGAGAPRSTPPTVLAGTAAQAETWRIQFTQSGGFAGVRRELEVTSKGDLIARDLKRQREVQIPLTEQELARLAILVKEAPSAAPRPSPCNDCFEYTIDASVDGQRIAARVVDVQLDASGFRPLVSALRDVLTRALATLE